MHPAEPAYAWSLADFHSLRPQSVRIHSATGTTLAARFFAGRSRATVVLSHGYGGTQDEMLPVADVLHRAGFSVLTYDLRGCGQSGGGVTFGALEQRDLISVVNYLSKRPDVDAMRIGALGFSMGASTTILAAARDRRIQAVVDDSGWSHVSDWLRAGILRRPTNPFSALSLRLVELREGIDLGGLRPENVVGRLAPRPILIIHGTRDSVVPAADSRENFAAARSPKELWLVDRATHGATIEPGGATTSARVVRFFRNSLGG
jgi:uncharacterized protein